MAAKLDEFLCEDNFDVVLGIINADLQADDKIHSRKNNKVGLQGRSNDWPLYEIQCWSKMV